MECETWKYSSIVKSWNQWRSLMTTLMNWSRCRGDWNNLGPNVAEKLTNIAENWSLPTPFSRVFLGPHREPYCIRSCHFLPRHSGRVAPVCYKATQIVKKGREKICQIVVRQGWISHYFFELISWSQVSINFWFNYWTMYVLLFSTFQSFAPRKCSSFKILQHYQFWCQSGDIWFLTI